MSDAAYHRRWYALNQEEQRRKNRERMRRRRALRSLFRQLASRPWRRA